MPCLLVSIMPMLFMLCSCYHPRSCWSYPCSFVCLHHAHMISCCTSIALVYPVAMLWSCVAPLTLLIRWVWSNRWSSATELSFTSAATLAYMGRPWLGLSVCSFMRITKEGRLCTHYPDQIGGDNLESRFIDLAHPRLGLLYPIWENVVCHAMAGVWRT